MPAQLKEIRSPKEIFRNAALFAPGSLEHLSIPARGDGSLRMTMWRSSTASQMRVDRANPYNESYTPGHDLEISLSLLSEISRSEQEHNIIPDCRTFALLKHQDPADPRSPIRKTPQVYILLHGLGGSPGYFKPLAKALFDSGANVVVLRQEGHGHPRQEGDLQVCELNKLTLGDHFAHGHLALAIARGLGESTHLVGFSHGGTLAAATAILECDPKYATRRSQNCGKDVTNGAVTKLTLISPSFNLHAFRENAKKIANDEYLESFLALNVLPPLIMSLFLRHDGVNVFPTNEPKTDFTYPVNPLNAIGWSVQLSLSCRGDLHRLGEGALKGLDLCLFTNYDDLVIDVCANQTVLGLMKGKGASVSQLNFNKGYLGISEECKVPHNFLSADFGDECNRKVIKRVESAILRTA